MLKVSRRLGRFIEGREGQNLHLLSSSVEDEQIHFNWGSGSECFMGSRAIQICCQRAQSKCGRPAARLRLALTSALSQCISLCAMVSQYRPLKF